MKLKTISKKIKRLREIHAAGQAVPCECLIGDSGEERLCGQPAVGHAGNGRAVGHLRDIGGVGAFCEEHFARMQPLDGDPSGFAHRW